MCFCFRFRPWWSEQMWFGLWEKLWCLPILQRCGWGICPNSFRSSVTKVRTALFSLVSRCAVGVSLLDCDWGNNRSLTSFFWGNKGFLTHDHFPNAPSWVQGPDGKYTKVAFSDRFVVSKRIGARFLRSNLWSTLANAWASGSIFCGCTTS